ncbi:hypothetical protein IPV69_03790 [Humisphaera borealis]|uniref:Uncharacterized protein n=2 Tax=Humisphaera borealis TaxID=2807512 RepID=A0A7M2WYK5_9BACT|nr:hypothetical protein IPV69_03790 [Humisphaera borealis]
MSIWIRTFSPRPLGPLNAEALQSGIRKRLLAAPFNPDEEEDPEVVLSRLRISPRSADLLELYYRADAKRFIPVERWVGDAAAEEVEEALEDLEDALDPGAAKVRAILNRTVETVAFELKLSDAQGMGWPLAIAAAATFAEQCSGVIYAEDSGWMVPSGNEVEFLVQE